MVQVVLHTVKNTMMSKIKSIWNNVIFMFNVKIVFEIISKIIMKKIP